MNSTISVIIATKDRPKQLYSCLYSLSKQKVQPLEIIIVDQSDSSISWNYIKYLKYEKIRYFNVHFVGKAKALNFAITKAKGKILSFTDDDCLILDEWIQKVGKYLQKSRDVAGIFGQTKSFQPEENMGKICPATFVLDENSKVSDPQIVHYETLGLGSNMSLRKEVFNEVGFFKEWLGPGTKVVAGAEESDLIYRILILNYSLKFNKELVIFHNRWLTINEEKIMQAQYSCGLTAFWVFHKLSKSNNFSKFMGKRIKSFICIPIKKFANNLLQLRLVTCLRLFSELFFVGVHAFYLLRGLYLGSIYFFINYEKE